LIRASDKIRVRPGSVFNPIAVSEIGVTGASLDALRSVQTLRTLHSAYGESYPVDKLQVSLWIYFDVDHGENNTVAADRAIFHWRRSPYENYWRFVDAGSGKRLIGVPPNFYQRRGEEAFALLDHWLSRGHKPTIKDLKAGYPR